MATITETIGKVGWVYKGLYDATAAYKKFDCVKYQGSLFLAKGDTAGNLPTNTTYWDQIVDQPVITDGSITNAKLGESVSIAKGGTGAATVPQAVTNLLGVNITGLVNNAGLHNSIWRGKQFVGAPTAEQYAQISARTYDDLWLGDYWTINNINYRIVHFGYYDNVGDTAIPGGHITLMTDTCLYYSRMNSTNIVAGAYAGSEMRTANLANAKTTINAAFGSAHILNHRVLLPNAVSGDSESGWAWYDSTVELPTELQLYGARAWGGKGNNGYCVASQDGQFAAAAINHNVIHNRERYWLQDVAGSTSFAIVSGYGCAADLGATTAVGVRPAFSICA